MLFRIITIARDTLIVIGFVAVPPAGLYVVAGSPVPRQMPGTAAVQAWLQDPLSPEHFGALGLLVGWLLWAGTVVLIAASLASRVRRPRWGRLRPYLPGPMQGLAATVLGAAAVTSTTAPAHAALATAVTTVPVSTGHLSPAEVLLPAPHPVKTVSHAGAGVGAQVCTVEAGDSLFSIAQDRLGDGDRWPEIFRLNRGSHHTGGTLSDPDLIYPGWQLRLPDSGTRPVPPNQQPNDHSPQDDERPLSPPSTPAPAPSSPPAPPITPPDPSSTTSTPSPADSSTAAAGDTPATATASPAADQDPPSSSGRPGVGFGDGSWMDLGLAAAIIAAVALVWAHRRRRYTPHPVTTDLALDRPELAPMPTVIARLRRGLRRPADPDTGTAALNGPASNAATDPDTDADDLPADTVMGRESRILPEEVDIGRDGSGTTAASPTDTASALVPAMTWLPAGLGLTGAGAQSAARGLLISALAGPAGATPGTQVVMTSATTRALLDVDPAAVPDTPRLVVTDSLAAALDLLDTHVLDRSRLLYDHDVDTITHLDAAVTGENPVPPVLLLADATDGHQRRIAALLAQGSCLDLHGVLLGQWPDGDTITVAADGTTSVGEHDQPRPGHPADVGRLTVLTSTEACELLATVAEAHTGQPSTSRPADQAAAAATPTPVAVQPDPTTESTINTPEGTTEGRPRQPQAPTPPGPEVADSDSEAAPVRRGDQVDIATFAGPVEVGVLGTPTIVNLDTTRSPRKKALELLVYLAVHDGSATVDAILDDLLPEAPTSKAAGRLYTYVSDLRHVLRRTAGPATYLTHPGHRYVLNPDTVTVDLWTMRTALRAATHASDPAQRRHALRQAVDAYRGPLAADTDYEWIEPYREAIRQQALDAHLALADLLTDQPAEQIGVLQAAIGHNPYAEELYQRAMHAHARLGHHDVIRTLLRDLTRALAGIDAAPSPATITLADELTSNPPSRHARPAGQSGTGAAS